MRVGSSWGAVVTHKVWVVAAPTSPTAPPPPGSPARCICGPFSLRPELGSSACNSMFLGSSGSRISTFGKLISVIREKLGHRENPVARAADAVDSRSEATSPHPATLTAQPRAGTGRRWGGCPPLLCGTFGDNSWLTFPFNFQPLLGPPPFFSLSSLGPPWSSLSPPHCVHSA